MNPIRIGKVVEDDGTEFVVVELFGVTLAYSHQMVEHYDREPDFAEYWSKYFMQRVVGMLAEQMHTEGRVRSWSLPTRLAPEPPSLPREGGEG